MRTLTIVMKRVECGVEILKMIGGVQVLKMVGGVRYGGSEDDWWSEVWR